MDIRSFQLNLFVDRHVLGAQDARAGMAVDPDVRFEQVVIVG